MKLRLMPDYDCHPLWEVLSDGVRNVAPEELPISVELQRALSEWADSYDKTLNRDDPPSSGFASTQEEDRFEDTGLRLWAMLQKEMAERAEVTYFSQKQHREINS